MKLNFFSCIAAVCVSVLSFEATAQNLTLTSPDGNLKMEFRIAENGTPQYSLDCGQTKVILPSNLGFELRGTIKASEIVFEDNGTITKKDAAGANSFHDGFTLEGSETSSFDQTWSPVWGEEASIRNNYNELTVNLVQKSTDRKMTIRFRLYDDGLGFRYEFPYQRRLNYFVIKEEMTQFAMNGDHTAWWIPGDYDTQEYDFTESRLSEISSKYSGYSSILDTGVGSTIQSASCIRSTK